MTPISFRRWRGETAHERCNELELVTPMSAIRFPPLAEPRGVRFRTVTGMSGFRRDGNFASRPIADVVEWHFLARKPFATRRLIRKAQITLLRLRTYAATPAGAGMDL